MSRSLLAPTDAVRFDAGLIAGLDKFGAVPLPLDDNPTTGGGTSAYLRLVYFW